MALNVSIKQTRDNLAELVERAAFGGEEFILTKFGKPKAMLVPFVITGGDSKSGLSEVFGAWKDRVDIKNSAKWAKDLRKKLSVRSHAK